VEKEVLELEEGVVVEGVLNANIVKAWITPRRTITLYMSSLTRHPIFINMKVLSKGYLMKNIKNT